ncbi:hypothetical protein CPSG_07027 [Coccidioides posadasii str. Silveira]|uniref:Uncharacterized protein n=1 Tax=Coccidioides posadasii (strain RMSCC 757 / Silveira) TaxID=443226 RepID=E9DB25_COCPS|nr:hypothetical protein CPSG_07027 [Coccidioides posadasii str. Silveira]
MMDEIDCLARLANAILSFLRDRCKLQLCVLLATGGLLMVFFVFQGIAIETLFPFMSALAKTLNEDIRRSALSPLRVQHRIPILARAIFPGGA